jgi:hypothetical protein
MVHLADGRPPIEKSTPPAMIADFEAQCVLGDDRLWRIQSHVLRPRRDSGTRGNADTQTEIRFGIEQRGCRE